MLPLRLLAIFAIAAGSYYMIEQPCNRMRRNLFEYARPTPMVRPEETGIAT